MTGDIVTDKPEAWTLEYIQGDLCGWHGYRYHHTLLIPVRVHVAWVLLILALS